MREARLQTEPDALFLPQFCDMGTLFVVVLVAELLAFALALTPTRGAASLWLDLALISLCVQWVALSSAGLLCALRPWLRRFGNALAGVSSCLLILLVTFVLSEAAYWLVGRAAFAATAKALLDSAPSGAAWLANAGVGHHQFVLRNLGISAIVSAVTLRYFYAQHRWREKLESEARARVQALQSRIRPHFLFNSMNTIASLTRTDPVLAEQVTEDLADLFRVSLADAGVPATLGDELEVCRQYLRIERQRLGHRLAVEWAVEALPSQALVPRLLLQPLVENAIYHGIEPAPDGGIIRIEGECTGAGIWIRIANPLSGALSGAPPAPESVPRREGNGIAQANVSERLRIFFGREDASLAVDDSGESYVLTLFFPYRVTMA